MLFTPEELEELRRADAEIDDDFRQTPEELEASRQRDKAVKWDRLDNKNRKIAEAQKAYYEANRERIAEAKKALLRRFRKSHGLSQRRFADALGVTQGLISQWETGMVPANLNVIGAVFPDLADALRK